MSAGAGSAWSRARPVGWWLLWSLPLPAGVYGRVFKARTAPLVDWGSVVCGAERVLAHQPLYDAAAKCPRGMSTYVHPPCAARWSLARGCSWG